MEGQRVECQTVCVCSPGKEAKLKWLYEEVTDIGNWVWITEDEVSMDREKW